MPQQAGQSGRQWDSFRFGPLGKPQWKPKTEERMSIGLLQVGRPDQTRPVVRAGRSVCVTEGVVLHWGPQETSELELI